MRAGRLRHRVTIQQVTRTRDGFGQPVESWSAFATVWAAVEPLRGREYFAAQQFAAETTHKITLRYLASVLPSMRVLFGSRVFRIEAIKDSAERNVQMELMCVEVLAG